MIFKLKLASPLVFLICAIAEASCPVISIGDFASPSGLIIRDDLRTKGYVFPEAQAPSSYTASLIVHPIQKNGKNLFLIHFGLFNPQGEVSFTDAIETRRSDSPRKLRQAIQELLLKVPPCEKSPK